MPRNRVQHPCGTYLAYQAHIRNHEQTDEACRQANRDYNNHRRWNPQAPRTDNPFIVARDRAWARLAEENPRRFRELLTEELKLGKGSAAYGTVGTAGDAGGEHGSGVDGTAGRDEAHEERSAPGGRGGPDGGADRRGT